jgi:hypothetical protein
MEGAQPRSLWTSLMDLQRGGVGQCRRPADRCAMDGLVDGATFDSRRYHTALALGQ